MCRWLAGMPRSPKSHVNWWVADRIGGSLRAGDGRESDEDFSLLVRTLEHAHPSPVRDVRVRDDKGAVCAGSDSMDHALAIEARELLDQMLVLQQQAPVLASALGVLIVGNGRPGFRSQCLRHDSSVHFARQSSSTATLGALAFDPFKAKFRRPLNINPIENFYF